MRNDLLVKDFLGIIPPNRKFTLQDIDNREDKQLFQGIDSFELSDLYSKISEYEVYEVNYNEDGIIIVYGKPLNDKIELNKDELVVLQNILLDTIATTPYKNINKDFLVNANSILSKVKDALYFYDEDD